MADSRTASTNYIQMQRRVEYQTRIIYFLSAILLALFLTWTLAEPDFTESQLYVLFILFFSVGLWITEAVPPFAVGILIIGFLMVFLGSDYFNEDPDSVKKYVDTWSDSVIWLLLGGFFLAEGMKKVGLDSTLFRFTIKRFGTEPATLLIGIMLATGLISMIMSNTATCAMMIAMITPLLDRMEQESNYTKALLLGIAVSATVGGMGTIIGSPPNAIAVGSLANIGIDVSFTQWMLYGVPSSIILIGFSWWLLIKRYPAEMKRVDAGFLTERLRDPHDAHRTPLERKLRKRLVLGTMLFTVLMWLTNTLHGIPVAAVSGIPILLLTLLGIIHAEDVRQLPWDTLMLVAGGLSLGLAIGETGLADHFIEQLQNLQLNYLLLLIAFSLLTVLLSNIMSNTATATILTPLAVVLVPNNPLPLPLVIGLSASCAFLLPVSTPPSAIAFSTGRLQQADFRASGLLLALLGPLLIIGWILLLT
jgi:sodium-dependent dicarboxylate transporter 2/3/5